MVSIEKLVPKHPERQSKIQHVVSNGNGETKQTVTEKNPLRPFLKWAGGKSNLLCYLRSVVPETYNNYIEPFVGGGALFFSLRPHKALLSDSNSELINCYRIVRDSPDELIELLESMPVNSANFYRIRKQNPTMLNDVKRAARLIYLNKTCYNGLYRVNKKGQFNAPFGQNLKVHVCNRRVIYASSKALKGVKLLDGDFDPILLTHAQAEDFIYLDPPYPSASRYSDFKRYTKDFFKKEDQIRLAKVVEELNRRGCKFVLSNAKHPFIEELYSKFRKIDVEAPRYINCRGDKRGNVSELLITNIQTSQRTSLSTHQIYGKQTDLTTIHIRQSRQAQI